jgi:hypothetical protein
MEAPMPDLPRQTPALSIPRILGHSVRGTVQTVFPRGPFDLVVPRDCEADGAQHFAAQVAA